MTIGDIRRQLEEQLAQQLDILENSMNNQSKVSLIVFVFKVM
jgi:hypothetical protein